MNLKLSLKQKWFFMTKQLIKPEDYRSITPYWCNRFILVDGERKPKSWWLKKKDHPHFIEWIISNIEIKAFSFAFFDYNIMTLGYPKSTDTERIIKFEHKGIEIHTGNPEWGAEPGKLYFVILHGELTRET